MQLDLEKAYDKLNWAYIRKVLLAYGFDHNWVRWVMALVTTSSFSILLNGSPSKPFNPRRGLRQGDPLSPFLFILMMKGLRLAIRSAKVEGKIQGLKLTENRNALTHQQFVDDTMLLGIPMVREALAYKQILKDFVMVAGIKANSGGKWRIWKKLVYRDNSPLKAHEEALTTILEQRKILVSADSDQLRWGNNSKGTFNLKEEKCTALGLDFTNPDWVWKDLWQNQGWMKIKLFMWLV
eukprot:PITA_18657